MADQTRTGPLIYVDANPFIYAVEGDQPVAAPMEKLLLGLRHIPGAAITSELTLAEVLAPVSSGAARSPDIKRLYLDLIIWSGFIGLRAVSREILLETTKARSVTKLKLPDAIHLCTAILNECRFFLTNDKNINLPDTMTLVRPDSDGITELLQALP